MRIEQTMRRGLVKRVKPSKTETERALPRARETKIDNPLDRNQYTKCI